jgi:hypothetical protein
MEDDIGFILAIVGFVIGGLTLLFAGGTPLARGIGSVITAALIVLALIIVLDLLIPTTNKEDDLE